MKDFFDLIIISIINNIDITGDEDIKDIKDIIAYDFNYIYILILLAVIIAFLLFILLRNRKNSIPEEEKPALQPEAAALEKLNKLRELKLIEQGRYKEFYTILSDIIREYFEHKYKISALDRTSYEIISALKSKNVIGDKFRIVQELLFDCDLVKFAKYLPPEEEPDKMLRIAEEIINIPENKQAEDMPELKSHV